MIRPPDVVDVTPGPMLLSGIADGPSLAAHRVRQGPLPEADAGALLAVLAPLAVRGRGGAGFPLARKIDTVLAHRSRRPGRRPDVQPSGARPRQRVVRAVAGLARHGVDGGQGVGVVGGELGIDVRAGGDQCARADQIG